MVKSIMDPCTYWETIRGSEESEEKDQYNTATMKQVSQEKQQRAADEVSPMTETREQM